MTVPSFTDGCWLRLAQAKRTPLLTAHGPTELMLTRVLGSSETVAMKAAELYAYFARWPEHFQRELAQIRHL
jgi:hypothetical protein